MSRSSHPVPRDLDPARPAPARRPGRRDSPRPRLLAPALALAFALAPVAGPGDGSLSGQAAGERPWIPPGADAAIERLSSSPRHGEWGIVRLENGDSVRVWIVHPETSRPAPVMVVIHEIYGLTHWIRAVADQLAEDGFLAVAPDLLTMHQVATTDSGDPDREAAVAAIRQLDADDVQRRLRAVAEFAMGLPSARPVYGVIGFCWGGSASFEHATRHEDLLAAVVYYGASPEADALGRVDVPVLGLYGGDDERVNATIPRAREALADRYFPAIYDGAGHGFLRQQDGRDGANLNAALRAWPHTIGFLEAALFARATRGAAARGGD